MSGRSLRVYLDGRACGELTQTSGGNLTFAYDVDYQRDPDAIPLSLSMPLAAVTHRKKAVLPFLQGLLPDNDMALNAMARRFAVSAQNPFALLEHMGEEVAGALQILDPDQPSTDATGSRSAVRPVTEPEVADMLGNVVAEYESGRPFDKTAGRFSLAGAQPKIALHWTREGWGVPREATPTTHILKPAVGGRLSRLDVVEQMSLRAARALGNDVAHSELTAIGDWHVLVSERYDRRLIDGVWHRIHQEDLCQALSVLPSKKYQHGDGGPGTAVIADLVRSLPLGDREATGEAFYRALVFNVVAGCTDAHAKNYSVILTPHAVRLAPLYDLLTYAGYWSGGASVNSAMSIGGEYSMLRIAAADLVTEGARFGVGAELAGHIVDDARTGMLASFEQARSEVLESGSVDVAIADDVLRGLRQLPLVLG